jgi:hypothetical protein
LTSGIQQYFQQYGSVAFTLLNYSGPGPLGHNHLHADDEDIYQENRSVSASSDFGIALQARTALAQNSQRALVHVLVLRR